MNFITELKKKLQAGCRHHTDHSISKRPAFDGDMKKTNVQTPDRFHSRPRIMDSLNDNYSDSSYEKIVTERRGSMPLLSTGTDDDDEEMDEIRMSTPSKFANFFMRKGFKGNLKRAKSTTKLYNSRKRSASNSSEHETTSFVGSMKRTMSLGRLSRKRNRQQAQNAGSSTGSPSLLSLFSSRIHSSKSEECLAAHSVNMQAINQATGDLHVGSSSRVQGQEHCFKLATPEGCKYFSCKSHEEWQKWNQQFKKAHNSDRERRKEHTLKICIKEAKNIPNKKCYYCDILLDKEYYARTTSKMKANMLFWGESFDFSGIRPTKQLTVNIYRDVDKKKKKERCLVGYVHIPISDISGRHLTEKWYMASSGTVGKNGKEIKNDLPFIRVQASYQTVDVLPMELYSSFKQYLLENHTKICHSLEDFISVKEKENIATTLVTIMQKLGKCKEFLTQLIMEEISKMENKNLVFRGNTIATKAMEAYMKLVGNQYLKTTLSDLVRTVIDSNDDCEVDPTKLTNPACLTQNQKNVDMYCEMALAKILNSHVYFPCELREVFSDLCQQCKLKNKEDFSDNLISASIFLRFLCPAILSPSLFNLTQEFPSEKAARNLTLIAKTIQTLANLSKFGSKEEYMTFMNEFLERQWGCIKIFFEQISTTEGNGNKFLRYDEYIDLGKELATLHVLLVENYENSQDNLTKMEGLKKILDNITTCIDKPDIAEGKLIRKNNRKSQIYDNMLPPVSGSSPTEVFKEMMKHCGEDIPALSEYSGSQRGNFDISSSQSPAFCLDTSDDYVTISALSVSARKHSTDIEKSWNDILNAVESNTSDTMNGTILDMSSFTDEDVRTSPIDMENGMNGSQRSISSISNIASSGYQSFGYSQSSSPVESTNPTESYTKSPSTQHLQTPLSFSNPMYRHLPLQPSSRRDSTPLPRDSTSEEEEGEEENTEKYRSTKKHSESLSSTSSYGKNDTLRNLAPKLSSSSSSESLKEHEGYRQSRSSGTNYWSSEPIKFSLEMQTSCPRSTAEETKHSHLPATNAYASPASSRSYDLPHTGSMDFSVVRDSHRYNNSQLRRTSTDSSISHNLMMATPKQSHSDNLHPYSSLSRGHVTADDNCALKKVSPSNTVHLGIQSVRRKISEQNSKIEYDQDVEALKQELTETKRKLQIAEAYLEEQHSANSELMKEWRQRLEDSEERNQKKDQHMKVVIERFMHVESQLRRDQEELEKDLSMKKKIIEAQKKRIQSLDNAKAKLWSTLTELTEDYSELLTRVDMVASNSDLKCNLTPTEFAEFKTSSC